MTTTGQDAKAKALQLAMLQIEKAYGKEAIMRLGDKAAKSRVDVIPTGALSLDLALGIGGVPRGRIIEIYGPESSGKTTLALQIVAQAQKAGGTAAFIDAEHAMDPAYSKALGVDTDNLVVTQPDSGEQALEITEKLVRSGALDVIVVDSVAALVPQAEIEGEMGDQHMGLQARLMSQALRKLTSSISRTHTCLVFINQIRHKIGVMFGNPETTTGGLALKFYASVRLDIRRVENLKDGDLVYGMRCRVKVVKNKVAPPYRQATFDMIHGKGISREGCLVDMAQESGIVEKSGSWLLYKGERLGQGRENAKAFLRDSPKLAEELEKALRAKFLVTPESQPTPKAAAEKTEEPATTAKAKK
ncbi:MAG: recombinase RecA [Elusimicrobiota bacterium]